MSWISLTPVAKVTGKPMVSVRAVVLNGGQTSLHFTFSSVVQSDFGDPSHAVVQVGADDQAGKLRIVFGAQGEFACKRLNRGGFRLTLRGVPSAPDRDFGSEPCKVELSAPNAGKNGPEGGELIIGLPVTAWADRSQGVPLAGRPERGGASPPPAPPAAASGSPAPIRPLDAVDYLTGKGHKITRLAEGRFALDGDTVVKGAVVKAINKHRAKAGLDALSPDSVA
jgi:hypothetical protein